MRKLAAAIVILSLMSTVSTAAKTGVGGTSVGQWSGGAHLGYSLGLSGFGGWSNSVYGGHDWGYKPTFAFDVCGQYQWKKNLGIGAEIYWQGAKWDSPSGFSSSAGSWTSILFLGMYEMNPGKPASMLLLGGAGLYESEFGINGGIGYRKFMSPQLALAGGARAHWVFSGTTLAWLHLFFGVQYFFGK
ncbi:MAG: hypothetical protein NT028_07050 [candidate division Zixibacteria bacterium]|nr:hypothetical protein [candidate division Zixibacteria bacterium]